MSVHRIPDKKSEYTSIANMVLNNRGISYQALGVLVYLLSKPPNWQLQINDLIRPGKNGETQVYRILEELQLAGHVVKDVGRNTQGRITCVNYVVSEQSRVADPALIAKLTEQNEKRRKKKQADNRRRSGQPCVAKPEVVEPDLAKPPPIKERGGTKDRIDKEDPSIPCQGKGGQNSTSPTGVKEAELEREAATPASECPTATPAAPPFVVPASAWPTATPEAPPVAADAAPEEDAHDEPGTSSGGVLSKLDPKFPRQGRAYDYCTWLREIPAEAAAAEKLSTLYPRATPIVQDHDLAEKYYNRRYTGMLRLQDADMIARYWGNFWVDPTLEPPDTLDGLLRKDKLPIVIGACKGEVRLQIQELRMDGEEDDGPNGTLRMVMLEKDIITAETDLLSRMLGHCGSAVAVMFAGYENGAQNLEAAKVKFRQEIIDNMSRWPHWLAARQKPEEYPLALGITMAEAEEYQRRFFAEKEAMIAQLKNYL